MFLRVLMFVTFAVAAYLATIAGAFVYWDLTGASGPDYTPLLFVLFVLAPAVSMLCGALALRRLMPAGPAGTRRPDRRGPHQGSHPAAPVPTQRHRRWHLAIAIGGALLVLAVMLWLGHTPHFTHVPRLSIR